MYIMFQLQDAEKPRQVKNNESNSLPLIFCFLFLDKDSKLSNDAKLALDIHDAIDAIIVATGLLYRDLMGHNAAIVTKDKAIASANIIRTVW